MASVEKHYEDLLARHYTWMRGNYEERVREYRECFEKAGIVRRLGGEALDLGAGSGLQSVALVELGFKVLAVDTSEMLLGELREQAAEREVRTVLGDIRDSRTYGAQGPFEVVVCMGDTLTHLRSSEEVATLIRDVRSVLRDGGTLVLEFRDYTVELKGADRLIPVRLDDDRIMTTFLEYEEDRVHVHDLVLIKGESGWTVHKSAYAKLRLDTERVLDALEGNGFRVVERGADRGFTTLVSRV